MASAERNDDDGSGRLGFFHLGCYFNHPPPPPSLLPPSSPSARWTPPNGPP